jgi:hypothetical protein
MPRPAASVTMIGMLDRLGRRRWLYGSAAALLAGCGNERSCEERVRAMAERLAENRIARDGVPPFQRLWGSKLVRLLPIGDVPHGYRTVIGAWVVACAPEPGPFERPQWDLSIDEWIDDDEDADPERLLELFAEHVVDRRLPVNDLVPLELPSIVIGFADAPARRVASVLATLASAHAERRVDVVFRRSLAPVRWVPPPARYQDDDRRFREPDLFSGFPEGPTVGERIWASCPLDTAALANARADERGDTRVRVLLEGMRACGCAVDDDAVLWFDQLQIPLEPVAVIPLVDVPWGVPLSRHERWEVAAAELMHHAHAALEADPTRPFEVALTAP